VRQRVLVLLLAAICVFAGGCTKVVTGTSKLADRPGPPAQSPLDASTLDGLLLDTSQINTALGSTSMNVLFNAATMWDWSASISDKSCLAVDGPAQLNVYTDTGWTAMRGQRLDDSVEGKNRNHYIIQAVVAFPSAREADAFYNASIQSWNACSNRQYHDVNAGKPDTVWSVGAITKDNGTLSTTQLQEGGSGWSCDRALTVRNNISIDVVTCANSQSNAAVDVALQIAAKVARS
jgi:hypothetical protein